MPTAGSTPPFPEPIFIDRYDLPYIELPYGPMYLSASVSIFIDDGVLYCKKCYEGVEGRLAAIPEPCEPALPLEEFERRTETHTRPE
ncbi:hypothetical protein ACN27G_29415 [Plantactinospora sp. WMMB334]|uniref:hypothetical protein n=1 Tax=Plantactinospora sp. WMMB334 TaxID=3404119 RepID=UPI003B92F747